MLGEKVPPTLGKNDRPHAPHLPGKIEETWAGGSRSRVFKQIGNAVPPALGRAVLEQFVPFLR